MAAGPGRPAITGSEEENRGKVCCCCSPPPRMKEEEERKAKAGAGVGCQINSDAQAPSAGPPSSCFPYHHHQDMLFSLFTQLLPAPSTWVPRSGADVYRLCQFAFLSTPLLLPVVHIIHAPHGRFSFPSRWNVNGNVGWLLMEIISPITFVLALLSPALTSSTGLGGLIKPDFGRLSKLPTANLILAAAFVVHYFQRSILHPVRSARRSPMHISVPISAVIFNLINGFLMGSWIGGRSPVVDIPAAALDASKSSPFDLLRSKFPTRVTAPGLATSPINWLFIVGMVGWAIGFAGNVYHDEVLLDLRRPKGKRMTAAMREDADSDDEGRAKGKGKQVQKQQGQQQQPRYGIPKGGLFKYVSFPNYLSECEYERDDDAEA